MSKLKDYIIDKQMETGKTPVITYQQTFNKILTKLPASELAIIRAYQLEKELEVDRRDEWRDTWEIPEL